MENQDSKFMTELLKQLDYCTQELENASEELARLDTADAYNFHLRERRKEFRIRVDQLLKLKDAIEGE